MSDKYHFPHVHIPMLPAAETCPACVFANARMKMWLNYTSRWQQYKYSLEVKYWWGGTEPSEIDDELGEVLDGQFWGPQWLRPIVSWAIDTLERMDRATMNKWTLRYVNAGKKPPIRFKRQVIHVTVTEYEEDY